MKFYFLDGELGLPFMVLSMKNILKERGRFVGLCRIFCSIEKGDLGEKEMQKREKIRREENKERQQELSFDSIIHEWSRFVLVLHSLNFLSSVYAVHLFFSLFYSKN